MSSQAWRHRLWMFAVVFVCRPWCGTAVMAQDAAGAPPANQVESDPVKCWWKIDTSAVRVGEPFMLVLTCGVIETSAIRVVVDPARLDPAALELTPFDVLAGTRGTDIPAPPWRYFQYSYTLRLLGDEYFGRDVDIPALPLTYRVQSAAGDAAQGRDHLYLLPALPVRVLSLVPVTATDIRDVSAETFADIEGRSFRSTRAFAAAGILFASAMLLAGVAVARVMRRSRVREPVALPPLPLQAVLHACDLEGRRVKSEAAAAGWTPELIGRGLTMFRIAGAAALGRPVAQALVEMRTPPREGQLGLRKGLLHPKRVLVSASTTAAAVAAYLATHPTAQGRVEVCAVGTPPDRDGEEFDPRTRPVLEDLAVPLRVFGAAHFSRNGQLDAEALDGAMDHGMRALHRLLVATGWRARAADALARTAAALREATWAR